MNNGAKLQVKRSRREFLATGGSGAAGLLLSSTVPASTVPQRAVRAAPTDAAIASPAWAKDLIIYEIATKGFTSPNGPESGTFNSLKAKIPYLQDLGVNGIWLSGHSLSQAHYFYNIWSQYANLEPDKIDPSLGTPEGFKSLIDAAHLRGIKIFVDVHVHGVVPSSPLIKQHPTWFRKWIYDESCVDYDWLGGHPDLDDWWVSIWTDCITRFGVDGFRMDINMARPDLWARVRRNAAAHGHEIIIFEEGDFPIPGVSDFTQKVNAISNIQMGPGGFNHFLTQDVPGFYDRKFGRKGEYQIEIRYEDGSRDHGSTSGAGMLRLHVDGLTADKVGRRHDGDHIDGIRDLRLTVNNVSEKPIEDIILKDDRGGEWRMLYYRFSRYLVIEGKPPSIQVYVATLGHGYSSIQLSCHDNGWEGFPQNLNPFVAQGSRALFGYSCLFTPMIPIFFSGEEFDASFRPIPWMSPHFLGGQDAGKGRWLYGCMLDWNELDQPEHRAMFEDIKTMIAIRKQHADVLSVVADQEQPKLMAVPFLAESTVPIPYIRWNERWAVLIAANRDENKDVQLKLQIPVQGIGMGGHARYTVTDLWPDGATKTYSCEDLENFALVVKRDRTQGGGLRLLRIQPKV